MTEQHYDVLVLGFGKAGKTIAMKRAKAGDKVAIIERDPKMYGGACINIGCVPTKKLLTEAKAFELIGGDEGQGLKTAEERRNAFIDKLNAANLKMAETAGAVVIVGQAAFAGEKTVKVTGGEDELTLTADTIIINTGAVPVWPPIPGIDGERIFNSTTVQQIDRPKRLAIVGGGPIGIEFATLFSGFGTEVTVIDAVDKALARFDRDIAEEAKSLLEKRGIKFQLGAGVKSFEDNGSEVTVNLDGADPVVADAVLVAIGRAPATKELNLEAAGIEKTERGAVKVDERLRTNVDGIYAAGDVNGGPQFTYISFDDHRIILADRWGDGELTTEGRIIPTATFMEPPLATVGMTEEEAKEAGVNYEVRKAMVADIPILPRPKIVGQPEGMVKFIVDKESNKILGGHMLMIDSQELINLVALAMRHGITAHEVGEGIYTHPASAEVFNALLP